MFPVGTVASALVNTVLIAEAWVIGHTEFTDIISEPEIELM